MAPLSVSKLCTDHYHFDLDLWVEILTRLPVTTICGFRCVCKSWNYLISSSFFIRRQLSFITSACSSSSTASDVFVWNRIITDRCLSYAVYNLRAPPSDQYYPRFLRTPFRDRPSLRPHIIPSYFDLFDVIHGVACLAFGPRHGSIILWNPVIHKYLEIPPSPFHGPNLSTIVGFGFDGRTNYDFKVVCEVREPPQQPPSCEVFSTRDGGSWRKLAVADHIVVPCDWGSNCFSNGALYWLVSRRSEKSSLLMFDCEHEEFKTMELPPQLNQRQSMALYTLYGMLSLVAYETRSDELEWWVLEEYDGLARTWKKMALTEDFDQIVGKAHYHSWSRHHLGSKKSIQGLKELLREQLLTAYAFEESMLLMEAKSYTVKEDEDGKMYYVIDGRRLPAEPVNFIKNPAPSITLPS